MSDDGSVGREESEKRTPRHEVIGLAALRAMMFAVVIGLLALFCLAVADILAWFAIWFDQLTGEVGRRLPNGF